MYYFGCFNHGYVCLIVVKLTEVGNAHNEGKEMSAMCSVCNIITAKNLVCGLIILDFINGFT